MYYNMYIDLDVHLCKINSFIVSLLLNQIISTLLLRRFGRTSSEIRPSLKGIILLFLSIEPFIDKEF